MKVSIHFVWPQIVARFWQVGPFFVWTKGVFQNIQDPYIYCTTFVTDTEVRNSSVFRSWINRQQSFWVLFKYLWKCPFSAPITNKQANGKISINQAKEQKSQRTHRSARWDEERLKLCVFLDFFWKHLCMPKYMHYTQRVVCVLYKLFAFWHCVQHGRFYSYFDAYLLHIIWKYTSRMEKGRWVCSTVRSIGVMKRVWRINTELL